MAWEVHQPTEFKRRYGDEAAIREAERLRSLLEENGLPLPRFPGMVWAYEVLPGGEEAVVGIAASDGEPLAYLLPADRVQFDSTEEVVAERRTPGGAESVRLHWYTPRG